MPRPAFERFEPRIVLSATTLVEHREWTSSIVGLSDVLVFDHDGDGDQDLFASSSMNGSVSMFANESGGKFGLQVVIGDLPGVTALMNSDVDADGDADLLARANESLFLFEWTGDNFAPPVAILSVEHLVDAAIVDMDLDGYPDILWLTADRISWSRQHRDGSFAGDSTILRMSELPLLELDFELFFAFRSVTPVPATRHDAIDLLFVVTVSDPVVSYSLEELYFATFDVNRGIGVPTAVDWHRTSEPEFPPVVGDIDGDGVDDIAWSSNAPFHDTYYAWLRRSPDGSWQKRFATSFKPAAIADMDSDGDNDIVNYAAYWTKNIDGQGAFIFENRTEISTGSILQESTAMQVADLDNDGDLDVVSGWEGANLIWNENLGTGEFAEPVFIVGGLREYPSRPTYRNLDINGDGTKDLLYANFGRESGLYLAIGSERGLEEPTAIRVSHNIADYRLFDIDRDGDEDLFVAERSLDERPGSLHGLSWYVNYNGTFELVEVIQSEDAASVAILDMNGDGYDDVVGLDRDGISWYENDGFQRFADRRQLPVSGRSLFAASMHGNGSDSLLVESSDSVRLVAMVGDQMRVLPVPLPEGRSAKLLPFDVDGDGRDDLFDEWSFAWARNLGNLEFEEYVELDVPRPAAMGSGAQLLDVDGDGDRDLVIDNERFDMLFWYEQRRMADANNDSVVDFEDFQILSANFGRKSVGFGGGDFNQDGLVDFADFLILSANFEDAGAGGP